MSIGRAVTVFLSFKVIKYEYTFSIPTTFLACADGVILIKNAPNRWSNV